MIPTEILVDTTAAIPGQADAKSPKSLWPLLSNLGGQGPQSKHMLKNEAMNQPFILYLVLLIF